MTAVSQAEHEASLLCAIMRQPATVLPKCIEAAVTPQSFVLAPFASVYALILSLHGKGVVPERYTVALNGGPELEGVFSRIPTDAPVANAAHHIEALIVAEQKRKIVDIAELMQAEVGGGVDVPVILSTALSRIANVLERGTKATKTIASVQESVLDQWKNAATHGCAGLETFLPSLNRMIGGLRPCLCVLGGYRGEGKSTLARCQALHTAGLGSAVGVITPEDSGETVAAHIVGNRGDFSTYALDTGESHKGMDEIRAAWSNCSGLPIYMRDEPQTIGDVVNNLTMLKAKHDIKLGIVDHLQYILPDRRYESRNVEISHYSRTLAALSRRLDIPLLVLSQLSRDAERQQRKPRLSDLRDSGAIEQDARLCMLLYADAEAKHHWLEVAKNNYGPSGKAVAVVRVDGRQRFEEVKQDERRDYQAAY